MAGKLFLLFLLFVGFALFVVGKMFWWDKANEIGYVRVLSTPESTVFIDSVALNKTPLNEKKAVGEYLLKLIPISDATQAATWEGKVPVYRNATTYVNRELGTSQNNSAGEIITIAKDTNTTSRELGRVALETEPPGAVIYLDTKEKGVAPFTIDAVDPGEHEISVYLTGFKRRTFKIKVEPGYLTKISVKLGVDEVALAVAASESAKLKVPKAEGATTAKGKVLIKDTPTGFLRVRAEASVKAAEVGRVNPGELYEFTEDVTEWFKIIYESGKEGWVSGGYVEKQE